MITCQTDRWELHQPGSGVSTDAVFFPDRAPLIEAKPYVNEPRKAETTPGADVSQALRKIRTRVSPIRRTKWLTLFASGSPPNSERVSFVLGDLTDEEFAVAVRQRLPTAKSQRILQRLRLPAFTFFATRICWNATSNAMFR